MQAFVSDQAGTFTSILISSGVYYTVIAALPLPPGSWVAHGIAALNLQLPTPTFVQVTFLLDGHIHGSGVRFGPMSGPEAVVAVPVATALALDREQTLQLAARATEDFVATQQSTITAIGVESVSFIRDQYLGGPPGPATGPPTD